MPPIRIGVGLVPVTSRIRELNASVLETKLQARSVILMGLLKARMQKYPPEMGATSSYFDIQSIGARRARVIAVRGTGLFNQRGLANGGYQRTYVLQQSWHIIERGAIVQLYNNAREFGPRGGRRSGRPYAIFVHGSGDGTLPQAGQHIGRWPSLFEEFQKMKAELQPYLQAAVNQWVEEQV